MNMVLGKKAVFTNEVQGIVIDKYSKGMLSSDGGGWATDVYIVQDEDGEIHHIDCTELIAFP